MLGGNYVIQTRFFYNKGLKTRKKDDVQKERSKKKVLQTFKSKLGVY